MFTPGTQMLSQLSLVILFAYGGWLYVQGKIPLGGGLVVFAGLLQQFTGQVATISTIANSVQQSLAAARRVFEVMDTPVEVQSRPDAIKPPRLTGRMVFEKVTFGYHADKPVLTRRVVRGETWTNHRHFRDDGRGQEHVAGFDSAFLRPDRGPDSGGRKGFARPGPGRVPAANRHRLSGEFFVFEHGVGKHRLRTSARDDGTN